MDLQMKVRDEWWNILTVISLKLYSLLVTFLFQPDGNSRFAWIWVENKEHGDYNHTKLQENKNKDIFKQYSPTIIYFYLWSHPIYNQDKWIEILKEVRNLFSYGPFFCKHLHQIPNFKKLVNPMCISLSSISYQYLKNFGITRNSKISF